MAEVTGTEASRDLSVLTGLESSNLFMYSLLALCMVLVATSLSVALAVFPRRAKKTATTPETKKAKQECVVQVGPPRAQKGFSGEYVVNTNKGADFIGSNGTNTQNLPLAAASGTHPSRPADREPSEEPNPTETCVCVHCFPDLKALGQSNDRPPRAPFTFYQQAVLKAATPKGASLWTEDSLYSSGIEVHEEAAVG